MLSASKLLLFDQLQKKHEQVSRFWVGNLKEQLKSWQRGQGGQHDMIPLTSK